MISNGLKERKIEINITSYRVAEFIMNNSSLMLGFDTTTLEELYIKETHVTRKESIVILTHQLEKV